MAKKVTVTAELRKRTGSGVLNQMRREGYLPAVVYGGGEENRNIKIAYKSFADLMAHSASASIVVNLDVEGDSELAFVQDIQTEPLSGQYMHVDFLAIDRKTEITAHVPLHFVGDAEGVANGGVLDQKLHELEIHCLPKDLPEIIEVDVSEMKINDLLHVEELTLPLGVTTTLLPEQIVCSIQPPRKAEEETTEDEAAAEGGEAAEAKEGGDSSES